MVLGLAGDQLGISASRSRSLGIAASRHLGLDLAASLLSQIAGDLDLCSLDLFRSHR